MSNYQTVFTIDQIVANFRRGVYADSRWSDPTIVTYGFATDKSAYANNYGSERNGFSPFTSQQQQAAILAISLWTDVANITMDLNSVEHINFTALGGAERMGGFGVSGARLVDRATAYVLLLPDFGDERIVTESDWKPSHLLAFVHESREWLIDLGRTAELSSEAELPNPLGVTR